MRGNAVLRRSARKTNDFLGAAETAKSGAKIMSLSFKGQKTDAGILARVCSMGASRW